jgi:hypothetical protein
MTLPETIRHARAFNESPPAGFDGVFDWSWTAGCFGGSITPMDLDAVIERKGQFLVMETKQPGKAIPEGQMITLRRLHGLKCFTVLVVWGKGRPETAEAWYPGSRQKVEIVGVESIRDFARRWFRWADSGAPRRQP